MSTIKKILRFLRTFIIRSTAILVLIMMTGAVTGAYVFMSGVRDADTPDIIMASDTASPVTVTDREGNELAKIQPDGGIIRVVNIDRISDNMLKAIVAAEDGTFWTNLGFEPRRIISAAIGQLQGDSSAGGGSTISQQYVKNNLVGDEISIERKWKEILSATKMTADRDKEQIITDYLNSVYFGRSATGIEQAARSYYGVSAEELTISQSALLAGVVQSPSQWDPAINPDKAQERFDYVIYQMQRRGLITDQEAEEAQFPEVIEPGPVDMTTGMEDGATGLIASMALNELERAGVGRDILFDRGVTIRTTIDPGVHETIQNIASSASSTHDLRLGVASVDPATGALRGFYGGEDGYGFNYATAPQMTGSTFKVFTLAAAVANGISTSTNVSSAPYQAPGGVTINNSDGMTCGTCSIAEATKQSLNTSYHRIQDMLPEGAESTRKMAHQMGITAPLGEEDGSTTPSIVLGTYGTSPVDMAAGYATLAADGVHRQQHIVEEVISRFDNSLYTTKIKDERVLTVPQAQEIHNALAPIADYSNNNGLAYRQGYMKTGTVQRGTGSSTGANRDAWSVGYTTGDGSMSTAVWVGSDDGRAIRDVYGRDIWGANLPSEVWKQIMDQIS